ncbi:MAG: DNA-processing protein DprA [Pseudomonadota bacterium]
MEQPWPTVLNDHEKLAWLRLARTENLGPTTADQLLAQYHTASAALDALPDLVANRRGKRPVVPHHDAAAREFDHINRAGATLLVRGEAAYPAFLRQIDTAPIVLTVIGDPTLLHRPSVGVVGSRNASANGQRFAADIAGDLGRAGLTIVSGLALGIDGRAHTASVETGTVAVLAGGANVLYPRQHKGLYHDIAERGAIVSERPWGAEPMGRMFPQRNRIISGLSYGVVVIEAAKRSGTLITATRAVEQNREVFAVPGFPYDARSGGTNQLLRDGAVLTESADDVLAVVRPMMANPQQAFENQRQRNFTAPDSDLFTPSHNDNQDTDLIDENENDDGDDDAHAQILNALTTTPTAVDDLIRLCNLSASTVAITLTELELGGQVVRHPGNMVARLGKS